MRIKLFGKKSQFCSRRKKKKKMRKRSYIIGYYACANLSHLLSTSLSLPRKKKEKKKEKKKVLKVGGKKVLYTFYSWCHFNDFVLGALFLIQQYIKYNIWVHKLDCKKLGKPIMCIPLLFTVCMHSAENRKKL